MGRRCGLEVIVLDGMPTDLSPLHQTLNAQAIRFGPELARLAYARGLSITQQDGTTTPIAIAATPVVLEPGELRRRQRLAAHVSCAGLKMSRAALRNPALRSRVLAGLSPLEAEVAERTFAQLDLLATTRVDFFAGDELRALELNATIPAMQGYSDIAAEAFLDVAGRFAGVSTKTIDAWKQSTGSNVRALHDALLSGYRRVRPGRPAPTRIALLCRRNDAQLGELLFIRDRFRSLGSDTDVIHPDQLDENDEHVRVDGKRYDLVYRHLFVRRLEDPGLPGARAVKRLLLEPNGSRAVVLNPPASQVEVKSVFALLSQALEDDALARDAGLDEQELATIAEVVPWARMFRGPQLIAEVSANPDAFVLKRAWDYGGRAVFVGRAREEPGFRARVQAAWPDAPPSWSALCARAGAEARGGGFVVQENVNVRPSPHVLCHGDRQEWTELYVDFSTYASVGIDAEPRWGGVCRGSTSSIVNIVGGGGVVPLITSDVAHELSVALTAAP